MATIIVLASAGVILCISIYLALCRDYDDGIIGHTALGAMAFGSAAPLCEAAQGTDYEFLPTTALMYAAMAMFLARHVYRFRRWKLTGENDWSKSEANDGH